MNDPVQTLPDQPDSEPAAGAATTPPASRWRHTLTIGVVTCLFGVMTVTALRGSDGTELLANARESDLVVLLDGLTQRLARLQAEQIELSEARTEILQGDETGALARTREQLFAMEVLNGTVPVKGPGVRLTITDPAGEVSYDVMLGVVQELRDAGAEAIEINGVRVNGRTWFASAKGSSMRVSGERVRSPYQFKVIGSPQTLAVALQIPGGLADTLASLGAKFQVEQLEEITITAVVATDSQSN